MSRDIGEGDVFSEKRRVGAVVINCEPQQRRLAANDGKKARVTEDDMKEMKRRSGRCLCGMINVDSTFVGRSDMIGRKTTRKYLTF